MISPFTPDEIDPVSMLLRSRYLSDTPVEEIEAEVQLDPADAAPASRPGLWRETRGAHFVVVQAGETRFRTQPGGGLVSDTISRQPTREVHHSEGLFVAHRGD